jgi:hypothetical protein
VQKKPPSSIKTRCVGTTRMSPPWILRRLANVSPFSNSLSNRLRITSYCLRSVSSSFLKFTRFIQGNNITWTNLDMIRNLQHLYMNKKSYTNGCKLAKNHSTGTNLKTWSVTHHYTLIYQKSNQYLQHSEKKWWQLNIWPNFEVQGP